MQTELDVQARRDTCKALLVVLLVLAAAARLLPIEYGRPAPGYFSADEIDSVSRAVQMARGDLLPLHANKPTLYPATLAALYGGTYLAGRVTAGWTVDDYARRFIREPFGFYRQARAVSIAASIATLLLVVGMLRRHGMAAMLAGAVVLGFARSSIYYGHIAKEDALAAFWATVAFAISLAIWSQEDVSRAQLRRWLAGASLAAGLAFSTKYNTFFAALFPLLAWWHRRAVSPSPFSALGIMVGAGAAGFLLGTPYALLHPVAFVQRTLASPIASQVTGALNNVNYIDHHGPVFLGRMFWREFGPMVLAVAAAAVAARNRPFPRLLVLLPAGLYLTLLAISSQLDYQYLLPLTPLAAWATGRVAAQDNCAQGTRCFLGAVLLLGLLFNGFLIARDTRTWLGTDTRLEAAVWLKQELASVEKPRLLIVSPYYFQYHPWLDFHPETFVRLAEEAREAGGQGGYFDQALRFALQAGTGRVHADFLDVRVGYRNLPGGIREFEPQPFSTNWGDYAGRYDLVVVPGNSLVLQGREEPELSPYQSFITRIQAMPEVAAFDPEPTRRGGPSLRLYRPASAVSDEIDRR